MLPFQDTTEYTGYPFKPVFNFDSANSNVITSAYQDLGLTGTGTSGNNTITASATAAALMFVGQTFRIGGTDTYVVQSIVTTTITTTTNLTASYSAATIETIKVSQVLDQSGYNGLATQATAGYQPTYVGASSIGNMPAFGWDSADSLITVPSSSAITNIFHNGGTFACVFRVRSTGEGGFNRLIDKANNTLVLYIAGAFRIQQTTSGTAGTWSKNISLNTNYVIIFTINATTPSGLCALNSTTLSAPSSTTNPTGTLLSDAGVEMYIGNRLARDRTWDGTIARIMMWNRVLSDADVATVATRLGNKYGITIS